MARKRFETPPYDPALIRRFPEAERKPIKFSWPDNNSAGLDEFGSPIGGDPQPDMTDWQGLGPAIVDYWLD